MLDFREVIKYSLHYLFSTQEVVLPPRFKGMARAIDSRRLRARPSQSTTAATPVPLAGFQTTFRILEHIRHRQS
jgi:hypothetical protein